MNNKLLLLAISFAFLSCSGEGAKKGQEAFGAENMKEVRVDQTHTKDDIREKGLDYAMAVQAALGKTLQGKIKEEGTLGAIEFCNLNALAITDSLSREFGATVSRITDRPRNPQNQATDREVKYISAYREDLADGHTPKGLVALQDNTIHLYYPIVINDLCLQCHGTVESDITPEVYSKLRYLYPGDRALSYSYGELRGLWKVSFPEEQP